MFLFLFAIRSLSFETLKHLYPKSISSYLSILLSRTVADPLRTGSIMSQTRSHSGLLIEPDGGKLVELSVDESQRDLKRKEALNLPKIKLTKIDVEWVHVLSEGWASPLKGFMRESEFLQTLHFNSIRLEDGSVVNMSVPIVLAIDDSQKNQVDGSSSVALVVDENNPIAILTE